MINDEEDDIAEERKVTVKYNRKGWEEESSVPAYEIGGGGGGSGTGGGRTAGGGGMEKPSRLDTPMNQNGNNGKNGVVEGEAAVENNKVFLDLLGLRKKIFRRKRLVILLVLLAKTLPILKRVVMMKMKLYLLNNEKGNKM